MGKKNKGFDLNTAVKCLMIGILGSIILVAAYAALELAWQGLITNSEGMRGIYIGLIAVLVILIPVFTGAVAAWSASPKKVRFNGSTIAGAISGITGSLGFTLALSVLILTWNMSKRGLLDWNAVHSAIFPTLTTGILSIFSDIAFWLLFTLLSVMLSAIGGGIYFVLSYYAGKGKLKSIGISKKANTRIITYMAAVLLAIIVIPTAAAFAGEQAGLIKSQAFVYPVDVQRAADDSIVFTNNGLDRITDLNTSTPLIVYLASSGQFVKDISDQQAASKDMLNVTITPPGGLGLSNGSRLTVSGPDIVNLAFTDNATGKKMVHVMVIGTTVDGNEIILREMSV